jgi:hypothetical protein
MRIEIVTRALENDAFRIEVPNRIGAGWPDRI